MRIHELAKKYSVGNDELIQLLQNAGYDVKNHMGMVDYDMLAALERHFNWSSPAKKKAKTKKKAKATTREKVEAVTKSKVKAKLKVKARLRRVEKPEETTESDAEKSAVKAKVVAKAKVKAKAKAKAPDGSIELTDDEAAAIGLGPKSKKRDELSLDDLPDDAIINVTIQPTLIASKKVTHSPFPIQVVGTSKYRRIIDQICGEPEDKVSMVLDAILKPAEKNLQQPFDKNPIKVVIYGKTVGFLDSADAHDYKERFGEIELKCRANIHGGGWLKDHKYRGNYGIGLSYN